MWLLINLVFFTMNLVSFVFLFRVELYALICALPKNYQIIIAFLILSLKLRFQQWYGSVVQQIDNGQYVVSLVIGRKLVKLLIKSELNPPVYISDDEDVDITDEALPFFRIINVNVTPEFFFSDRLTLKFSDGSKKHIHSEVTL